MKVRLSSLDDTENLAQQLAEMFSNTGVSLLLSRDLGSGKTTFTQLFCKHLGSQNKVTSPTFVLMQEYQSSQHLPIYHFDLYRLESKTDLISIGIYAYLNESQRISIVEWPELLDLEKINKPLKLSFEVLDDNTREVTIEPDEIINR